MVLGVTEIPSHEGEWAALHFVLRVSVSPNFLYILPSFHIINSHMTDEKDTSDQNSIEELKSELEANPSNVNAISKLAQTLASRGDYNAACTLYEKLVRLDAENGLAWVALGHCHLLRGEYQKCFSSYQKALHTLQNNRDAQLWYGIGLLYTKFESYEYAEPAMQAVLRIDPNFEQKSEVYYKLGQIYKKKASYEDAITHLGHCIEGENVPLNRKIDGLCQIGTCYEKQSRMNEAINMYRQALELDPNNYKTLEYLGWGLAQSGLDGSEELKQALTCVGENPAEEGDLHYLLGRVAIDQQRYIDSKDEFQKAIFKNSNSYAYWCSIGILYATAQQPQDAFESFVKASNLAGDREEIWVNMGILYEHCRQKPEALLAYERALSHQPNSAIAQARRAELDKEAPSSPPSYVHPEVEISEVSFSLLKQEKAAKPDIGAMTPLKVDEGELPTIPQMSDSASPQTATSVSVPINTQADKQGLFGTTPKRTVETPPRPSKPAEPVSKPPAVTKPSGPVFKVTADLSRPPRSAHSAGHAVIQPQASVQMDPNVMPPGMYPMPQQSFAMPYYSPYVMPGQSPGRMAPMPPQMAMMPPQMMPMMGLPPGQQGYPGFPPQMQGVNPYFNQMMFAPYMMPSYYPPYYPMQPAGKPVEAPSAPAPEPVPLPVAKPQEKPKETLPPADETEEEEEEDEEEDDESDEDYEEYEFKKRRATSSTETRSKRRHC